MRDFRVIREYEVTWKRTQEQLEKVKSSSRDPEGGNTGLEGMLDKYIEEQGLDEGF